MSEDLLEQFSSAYEEEAGVPANKQEFDNPDALTQETVDQYKADLDNIRSAMEVDPDELARSMHRHFEQTRNIPKLAELYADPNDVTTIVKKMRSLCSDKYHRHSLNKTSKQEKRELKAKHSAGTSSVFEKVRAARQAREAEAKAKAEAEGGQNENQSQSPNT